VPRRFGVRRIKPDPPYEGGSGFTHHIWRLSREEFVTWRPRTPLRTKRAREQRLTAFGTTLMIALGCIAVVCAVIVLVSWLF
jgi:hypothetical protein